VVPHGAVIIIGQMPLKVIRARLNSLRQNLPTQDVEESVVNEFNELIDELEEELPDPEVSHFKVKAADVKQIWRRVRGKGRRLSDDKYCAVRIYKTQLDGVWEYLSVSGVITESVKDAIGATPSSGDIHIHGPVTSSVIQHGSHNTATVNYQHEVEGVLEEIRPLLNAAKLTLDSKAELKAEVETVEVQMKSPRPKHIIIRESLASARHILEHAFGAAMAHSFPQLLLFLEHHK
jgi:hypothetical protein